MMKSTNSHWKARPAGPEYDEMRERLVESAAALLNNTGVGSLRLDAVAEKAGCARSSIYRYFDSKDELVLAVIGRDFARLTENIYSQVKDMTDPAEQVVESVYLCIQAMRRNPHMQDLWNPQKGNNMGRATLVLRGIPSTLADSIGHIFLKEARARGIVRDNVSNKEALRWLMMIITSHGAFGFNVMKEDEEKDYLRKMLLPSLFTL